MILYRIRRLDNHKFLMKLGKSTVYEYDAWFTDTESDAVTFNLREAIMAQDYLTYHHSGMVTYLQFVEGSGI